MLDANAATITVDGAPGHQVVHKQAHTAAARERLQHEAEVLEAARHPGVVELLVAPTDGDEDTLTTAWAGAAALDTASPTTVEEAAALVAGVADTLADLHDLGLVHGRIEPSHVVVSPGGQPVLCGLAGGGYLGSVAPATTAPAAECGDPANPPGSPLSPSADVFGLGVLLRGLVVDGAADGEPIPDRRWRMGRLRPWGGYVHRALLTLADRATADDPARRPGARDVAAAIRDAVPDAHLPLGEDDQLAQLRASTEQAEPPPRRPLVLVMAATGLALLVLGGTSLLSAPAHAPVRSITPPGPTPSMPATTLGRMPDATPVGPTPVIVGDGVVQLGDQRFAVGAAGDVLALGDWDCDGVATPAVLRPSTGSVFRFDRWATTDADLAIGPASTVIGAVALRAGQGDGACPHLMAVLADGTDVEVVAS